MKFLDSLYILFYFLCLAKVNGLFHNNIARRTTHFIDNGECSNPANNSKFAIIIHGWRQTCDENYIQILTANLEHFRGDCVICMNYGVIGSLKYFGLVKNIEVLSEILVEKLQELESIGFNPANGYMYGFSFGARLAILAGTLFGHQRLGEIDVCDMAGPGFTKFPLLNSKAAAKNVQCIHTSSNKGTWTRDCHQNWNMGYCGRYQLAENTNEENASSHGLCNIFYNAAFHHNFYAEQLPHQCDAGYITPFWPEKFKMGYNERRKRKVQGQLYASTWLYYPYTRTRKIKIKNYYFAFPQE